MVDLWKVVPGDVIHRCNVGLMDQDVPLLVLSCVREPVKIDAIGLNLHVLALSMLASGNICLHEIDIDAITAYDYEWVIRLSTGRSSTRQPAPAASTGF